MQNSNQNPRVNEAQKDYSQNKLAELVKDFFEDYHVSFFIEHLNALLTDAIQLQDPDGEKFHTKSAMVDKVATNAEIVDFLGKIAYINEGLKPFRQIFNETKI